MTSSKLLLLTGSITVIGANSLALSPIAAAVAASFPGVAAAAVMTASAVYGLATAASALTLAPLADQIGADRLLLRALLLLSFALGGTAMAPDLLALCLAQALAGVAAGMALPSIYALAAQIAEKGRESHTLGLVLTGWTLSLVMGVSLAAVIADFAHWRLVFGLFAAAAIALAASLIASSGWRAAEDRPSRSSPRSALRVPGMARGLLTAAGYMTAFYGLYSYLGAHLSDVLALPTAVAGLAPLAYGLGFGGAAVFDRLIDRHGAEVAAPLAFAGLAVVYLLLAAAGASASLLLALCLLWGLANHLGLNLIVGGLAALDPTQRGAVMGLYSAVTYLSVFAGALLYRPVFEQFGFAVCALVSAACVMPALGAALQVRRLARS